MQHWKPNHGKMQIWRQIYRTAQPFPHIVLDNFLSPTRAESIEQAFPGLDDLPWYSYNNVFERKFAYDKLSGLPAVLTALMSELNSPSFLSFLEELTGITGLVADETFRGGGLHCVPSGGKLDIHADFNVHPVTGLYRRLNVILFLNREWKVEYGGSFELWNRDMTACEKQVLPVSNRIVIFTVTDTSFHGHPQPLATPEGVLRRSMAWYYYTANRPQLEKSPAHSTLYQRPANQPIDAEIERLRAVRAMGRLSDGRLEVASHNYAQKLRAVS
jgi:hypothetical protein